MADTSRYRDHIIQVVMERFSQTEERRREALREYMAAARPDVDPDMAEVLAENAPALLPSLYARWAGMFAERMLETISVNQIEYLCDGDDENNAAVSLAFIMFLESERMEAQMAEDLKACREFAGDVQADALAQYILGQGREMAEAKRERREKKAAAYRAKSGKGKKNR